MWRFTQQGRLRLTCAVPLTGHGRASCLCYVRRTNLGQKKPVVTSKPSDDHDEEQPRERTRNVVCCWIRTDSNMNLMQSHLSLIHFSLSLYFILPLISFPFDHKSWLCLQSQRGECAIFVEVSHAHGSMTHLNKYRTVYALNLALVHVNVHFMLISGPVTLFPQVDL